MKVVIFCGGKGTRLREETEYRPKPMVSIGGMPILWHIMKIYAHQGFKDFVLCLGYKGDQIKEFFRNYHWNRTDITLSLGRTPKIECHDAYDEEDWTVTLAETGENAMTAWRLKQVQKYIPKNDPFMLTYGDGLADINLNALVEHHQHHGKRWTLTAVRPANRFGSFQFDNNNMITAFEEKSQFSSEYINGGFMLCNYDVFDYLKNDPSMALELDPIFQAVSEKQLSCYQHKGFWQCMDTYREAQYLNKLWGSNQAPWKIW